MSRYRPPGEKGSAYVTAEGHARLRAEYDQLWRVRRPEVVRALAAAAAEGDRSENAEYQYRKKELREIDRRVRYLQLRLPLLQVVDRAPDDPRRVFFGAQVVLVDVDDEEGRERRYRIVGPDEVGGADISVDSPLARAMLNRAVGDTFRALLPAGEVEFEVLAVTYR